VTRMLPRGGVVGVMKNCCVTEWADSGRDKV
jgi:hypothetical protein